MIAAATSAVLAAAVAVFRWLAAAIAALAIEGDGIGLSDTRRLGMGLDTGGEEEGGESDRGEGGAHAGQPTTDARRPPRHSSSRHTSADGDSCWARAPDPKMSPAMRDRRRLGGDIVGFTARSCSGAWRI